MLKTFSSISLIIFLLLHPARSQTVSDTTYCNFGLSIGLNNYQIKEKVLNNIRHSGFFPALAFSYEWNRESIRQNVELFLMVNMLKSRYEEEAAPLIIDPSLSYSQTRKISQFEPDLHLYLGGSAGLYSHMAYFEKWDDSHFYWLTYYYLGISALLTYKNPNGPSSGYIEIGIPVISLVSRPPEKFLYKVINDEFSWIISEIHKDLRFTSIHQNFVLNIDLGYRFKHSDSFQQEIFWRITYINSQLPYSKELIILTHTLGTILLF